MYAASASSAAAAHQAAMANAIKAMGSVVLVEPEEFMQILEKTENPLVVHSPASFMTKYKYLTSYKGLTFFTKTKDPLMIPGSVELITAKKIVVPQL